MPTPQLRCCLTAQFVAATCVLHVQLLLTRFLTALVLLRLSVWLSQNLNGKLQGHAQRVSVVDGSLTELVSILKTKNVTADQVNEAIKKHTENNPSFGWNEDEIVSSDVIGTTYGSIFDPTQTEVTTAGDYQLVKTVTWYDNEYGFTCQMIRTLLKFATL